MFDSSAATRQIVKDSANVDHVQTVIVVENDKTTRAHNTASQIIIVSDSSFRMIAIYEHHITGRKVFWRQIQCTALLKDQFEPRVFEREFTRCCGDLFCLDFAGEVVAGRDVDADISLDRFNVSQDGSGSTAIVAAKLGDHARIHASHQMDKNVQLARVYISFRQPG